MSSLQHIPCISLELGKLSKWLLNSFELKQLSNMLVSPQQGLLCSVRLALSQYFQHPFTVFSSCDMNN